MSSIVADFFNLYKLPKYLPGDSKYGGFLPIEIKDSQFRATDNGQNRVTVDITLPWKVQEISDSVSVNISRRQLPGGALGADVISEAIASVSGSNEIAKIAVAQYDASSLNKTLTLDFILPLLHSREIASGGGSDFVQQVRTFLGGLQGLVYPSEGGYLYPPLLKIRLGGLYKGFKGMMSSIDIRTSEDVVDIGGEMMPLVITGTLKFVNVFMYTWSNFAGGANAVLDELMLDGKPYVLFGDDQANNISMYASNNPTVPTTPFVKTSIPSVIKQNLGIVNPISELTKRVPLKQSIELNQSDFDKITSSMIDFKRMVNTNVNN